MTEEVEPGVVALFGGRRQPRHTEPAVEDGWEMTELRFDRDAGDRDFLPPSVEMVEAPPARLRVVLGYALSGIIAAVILWACLAKLPIFAIAPGQITAAGGSQVVEPRETGQVSAIRVKDGEHVTKGEILVELNPTDAIAARAIVANQLADLRGEMARWQAEIAGAGRDPVAVSPPIAFEDSVPQSVRQRETEVARADLSQLAAKLADLAAQRKAKETAVEKYTGSIAAQKNLISVVAEHVGMHEQLAATGTESKLKLLEAQQQQKQAEAALVKLEGDLSDAKAAIPVIDAQIAQTRADFIDLDTQQLAAAERDAEDVVQQLIKADDKVKYMTVRAPVSGTVQSAAVTTLGQVVKPGQQLMQIVPDGAPLEIEAYVLNTDIGFVKEGQPVTLKIDTFPYTRYDTIPGKVTRVYSDAISGTQALQQQKNGAQPVSGGKLSDTQAAQATSDLVFAATIVPSQTTIEVEGKQVPLTAGMSVVAEIRTGEQRAISYILYPLMNGLQPVQGH